MASDLSSGCTDDIGIFDEKEEGEISLEDVSSSEESHPNYRPGFRLGNGRCPNCMSRQQCASWCNAARIIRKRAQRKQDAAHGKENRRHEKDSSDTIGKNVVATLREKKDDDDDDDDLVPISSDSDMEIVGLPGNSEQVGSRTSAKSSKVRKKKKKKRNHSGVTRPEEPLTDLATYKVDGDLVVKSVRTKSRSRHRETISPRYNPLKTSHNERLLVRSPSRRYRTLPAQKSRSPLRRSRSPATSHYSTKVDRKLLRKLRSPRKSPSRSPVKFNPSRESRDSKLLKKVRHLDSVGIITPKNKSSRSKEHSSLKEKLRNMMKNNVSIDNNEKVKLQNCPTTSVPSENNNVHQTKIIDKGEAKNEEDDDIELLRRLALETKQMKTMNKNEDGTKGCEDNNTRIEANLSDDNDSEALELRMIALHSAVMKKHRNRVERGLKSKRRFENMPRSESPFSTSFLDGIPTHDGLSNSNVQLIAQKSLSRNDEDNHPEDVELDTDLEQERDSMPYSPTDDCTIQRIIGDSELPIIETQETMNNDTSQRERRLSLEILNTDHTSNSHCRKSPDAPYSPSLPTLTRKCVTAKNTKNNENDMPYSPDRSGYTSAESLANYMENPDAPYSPSKPVEGSKIDYLTSSTKTVTNMETPYSPTDTPIYDPELTRFSPEVIATAVISKDSQARTNKNTDENSEWESDSTSSKITRNLVPMMLNMSMSDIEESRINHNDVILPENDRISESPSVISVPVEFSMSDEERIKSYEAIMDELPEIDLDGSPLVPVTKESSSLDALVPIAITSEPLYLQGLADVTRDTNKIPTLVNRTLVPASILKTNKQLQQPLPQKKVDQQNEPSFKSAEMRPVNVTEIVAKPTTLFKPIKLCSMSKKPQVIATTAAVFNVSLNEDTTMETSADEFSVINPNTEIIRDSLRKTETAQTTITSSCSSMPEKSPVIERSAGKLRKSSRKSTNSRERSPSSIRSRATSKVKAKSVETGISNLSSKHTKSTSNRATRRASSSSAIDKRVSHEKRSNDKSMDIVESGSELTDIKRPRRKSTHRDERKIRQRRRLQNNVNKLVASPLKNRRRSESMKKMTEERTSEIKVSRIARSKSTDSLMVKSVDGRTGQTSDGTRLEEIRAGTETTIKTVDKLEKDGKTEKDRRSSLDEDEEALRALLLASLPKRPKTAGTSIVTVVNPIINLSDTTNTSVDNSSTKLPEETTVTTNDSSLFTAPKTLIISSESSTPVSSTPRTKIVPPIATTKNNEVTREILPSETNNASSISSSSPLTPRKRPGSVLAKHPPKKITKKALPALASTKVVNNAKKYQNAMLQKKLNLQRAAMLYSAANVSRNITLNNLKMYETARPKMMSAKTQRLVINLESDTDSETEFQSQESSSNTANSVANVTAETRKPLSIPTTDFEKSVDQFLKDQRKKLESTSVTINATSSTITTTTTKSPVASCSNVKVSGIYSTPLAVRRHLSVLQQVEYRHLKQQILERERQMLQKTIDDTISQNPSSKSPCTPPGPLSPASPIAAALAPKSQLPRALSSVATQSAGTIVATSKEMEKIDDERGRISVTKVPKTIVSPIVNKLLVQSSEILPKVISKNGNMSNVPPSTSTPKALGDIAHTSCIANKSDNVTSKTSLPLVKSNVTTITKNLDNPATSKPSSISNPSTVVSSTSVSNIGKGPTESSGSSKCNNRRSVKSTEMLTIQIPNDKIQTNRQTLSSALSSKNPNDENNDASTTDTRSAGVLRILTKEQLNNRFVKIQVERGPTGRRVTVGTSTSHHDLSRSMDSNATKIANEVSDEIEENVFCDSSLNVNESIETRINVNLCTMNDREKSCDDSSVAVSEASTLILPRNENVAEDDSGASTLILTRDDSQTQENLEPTRFAASDKADTLSNAARTKLAKNQAKEVWEKIRYDVKSELEVLGELSADEQEILLLETQEKLVTKRNKVLEDLTEMSGCLHQWELEREIQTTLIAEVRRLREQLKTAEDRLSEQRRQMNDMGPRVTRTHEKINHGRRESYKLSRICQGLGVRVVGQNYKVPNAGARLLNERLKEVAIHTRQLSRKKVPAMNNSLNETRDAMSSTPNATIETSGESTVSPLRKSLRRMDTPSTSMSETENDDNDDDDDDAPTREAESSYTEANAPTNDRVLEQSVIIPSSTCPSDETNLPEKENGLTSLTKVSVPSKEIGASCMPETMMEIDETNGSENKSECTSSIEVNDSSNEMEISSLSETNTSSEKTVATSLLKINASLIETEVTSLSVMSGPPKEQEVTSLLEIDTLPNETDGPNSAKTKVPSRNMESSSCTNVNRSMTAVSLSRPLDNVKNCESEMIPATITTTKINLTSNVTDTSDDNDAQDISSMPGTSRLESPSLFLLNDSQPIAKQKINHYNSVLAHLKVPRNVNPNGILCPYELMGTCNDADCQYYHLDPNRYCSTTSTETNFTSNVTDISDENRAQDILSMPGTSRLESPSLSLLNDSQPIGKQKLNHYNSVLTHLKLPRNVNPNGILCPYELMGTCNDGDCHYYHLDPSRHCQ